MPESDLNCPNCGAPRTGSVCEYCGTHFKPAGLQDIFQIRIDGSGIMTTAFCSTAPVTTGWERTRYE